MDKFTWPIPKSRFVLFFFWMAKNKITDPETIPKTKADKCTRVIKLSLISM